MRESTFVPIARGETHDARAFGLSRFFKDFSFVDAHVGVFNAKNWSNSGFAVGFENTKCSRADFGGRGGRGRRVVFARERAPTEQGEFTIAIVLFVFVLVVLVVVVVVVVIVDGIYRAIPDDVPARVFFWPQNSNRRQDDASRKFAGNGNLRRVILSDCCVGLYFRFLFYFRRRRRRRRNFYICIFHDDKVLAFEIKFFVRGNKRVDFRHVIYRCILRNIR